MGAHTPEGYGNYYAWGEIQPKGTYSWNTYKYGTSNNLTKYNTKSRKGAINNKTTLDVIDDVAMQKWGGAWRMPTTDEWEELENNCTWTWTTQNGVKGYKVKSKKNGNSIFLPAAGSRFNNDLYGNGSRGAYWSSSRNTDYPTYALTMYIGSGHFMGSQNRDVGQSVRPVLP